MTSLGTPSPTKTLAQLEEEARQKALKDLQAGQDKANEIFKEGSLGRIEDQYKADQDALLKTMQSRIDGMTPEEKLAAQTQARVGINQQLNQNIGRAASLAAAQGIRGGAAVGLQQRAMNEALGQQGAFQRQLVLDNIAQRNQATGMYAGQLNNQQGVGLNVQESNLGRQAQELYGRTAFPYQHAGFLDSAGASGKADYWAGQQQALAQQALNDAKAAAQPAPTSAPLPSLSEGQIAKNQQATGDFLKSTAGMGANDIVQAVKNERGRLANAIEAKMPNASIEEKVAELERQLRPFYDKYGMPPEQPAQTAETFREGLSYQQPGGGLDGNPDTGKIICTESAHQGRLAKTECVISDNYAKVKNCVEQRNYLYWARHITPVMRRSPAVSAIFARAAAGVLRCLNEKHALGVDAAASPSLLDRGFFAAYNALNALAGRLHQYRVRARGLKTVP